MICKFPKVDFDLEKEKKALIEGLEKRRKLVNKDIDSIIALAEKVNTRYDYLLLLSEMEERGRNLALKFREMNLEEENKSERYR